MLIDQTFLRVHPATFRWWQQRGRCQSCKHLRIRQSEGHESAMRCGASKHPDEQVRLMLEARSIINFKPYCIDARSETGDCGPQGRLWEEK